jgi:phage protein D
MTELLVNPEPLFRIDGESVGLARDALSVEVEETTLGLRTLKLELLAQGTEAEGDEGLLFLDGPPIDFGKCIEVSLGAGDEARTVFRGVISAIEAGFSETAEPHVVVFAEDALMKLRITRRARTYVGKSDAQIAQEVAEANSLGAQASAEGPVHDYVQQWNQSDLAFLRDRALRVGAELWERDGILHFKSRTQRAGTRLTLVRGNELLELQVRADLAHQRTGVVVSGYDVDARGGMERSATGSVVRAEAPSGRTGPQVLEQLWEQRVSLRVRDNPQLAGEAQAWARAELLRRARGFVTAFGVTSGHPDLEVGSRLTLERVGRPFSGEGYYVTRARHTWDRSQGFRTHFEAERPTINEAS